MSIKASIFGAVLAVALIAGPAAASTQVFAWDFESPAPTLGPFPVGGFSQASAGGSVDGSEALPGFGSSYFHNATSGLTTFTLAGLGNFSPFTGGNTSNSR